MNRPTRRKFFEESMIAAGVLAASQVQSQPALAATRTSANDTVRHAVIGCRIRGKVHAREFAKLDGVEVAYVCDPDSKLRHELADAVEEQTGKRPLDVADLRTIFDDESIDTVSIAAPNHWHALAAIWAMQSGKDVYVEKPVSHNIVEGRRMVEVARKLNRICQGGTQNRSRGDLAAAAEYIRKGELGDVTLARTIVYGNRKSIGQGKMTELPKDVDFNLWLGPATQEEITRPNLHYDWHWVWDTGNGELGNNNIHYVDICRWLVGLQGLGESVVSIGGRVGYEDAGETPNTQLVIHQFARARTTATEKTSSTSDGVTVIQEVRGLKSDPFSEKFRAGHVIHGTKGFIAEGSVFDPDGQLLKTFKAPGVNHFENFVTAVRSRRVEDLRADILEGHQSTALCHIGNISHRLGTKLNAQEIGQRIESMQLPPEAIVSYRKMVSHLGSNGVDLNHSKLQMGPLLELAATGEEFIDNAAANSFLSREYRRPFVLPDASDV